MVFACTLICCEAEKYKEVVSKVKALKEVKRAFGVHGRWDVVVELEVANIKALGDLALKINELRGVRASETLVGF